MEHSRQDTHVSRRHLLALYEGQVSKKAVTRVSDVCVLILTIVLLAGLGVINSGLSEWAAAVAIAPAVAYYTLYGDRTDENRLVETVGLPDERSTGETEEARWAETVRLLDESARTLGRLQLERSEGVVSGKLRCPYCHDSLVGRVSTCLGCQAALHDECLAESKGCVTLGCKRRAPKWAVRA